MTRFYSILALERGGNPQKWLNFFQVMIWNQLACGDTEMCAIIVVFNSLLQIALYAPVAILFINVIGDGDRLTINYSDAALSVVIVSLSSAICVRGGADVCDFFKVPWHTVGGRRRHSLPSLGTCI